MMIPKKEALPADLRHDLEAMQDAARVARCVPLEERMNTFMSLLPESLETQLVMDRAVAKEPAPDLSDPRVLRLACATTNCYNLTRVPAGEPPRVGTPKEMMQGLLGLVGMLQLHLAERLGLIVQVEGPRDPWDWDHPVHYRSALPNLPAEMVRRGLWDPNPKPGYAFTFVGEPPL